jgi:PAS domain S-box-containing protein
VKRPVEELEARLGEAEELLRAIRGGEVEALIVPGPHGDQIYTLTGAEHSYRVMVEAMREGAVILAPDHTIVYSNRSFAAMVGLPLNNVIGSVMARFVVTEDLPLYDELFQIGTGAGKGELRLSARGTIVPVQLSISVLESGAPRCLCAVVTDLTEHRRHEELLSAEASERAKRAEAEEGHRRVRSILESITDSFFELDRSWRITEANHRASAHFGRTRDELLGCSFWDLAPRGHESDEQYRRAMTDRAAVHFDERSATIPAKWFERHIYPTHDGLAVYFRDITSRKEAEETLRFSEQRFRRYFDLGLIGMAITSASKSCIEVNDELCRILGYEREELLRMTWAELTHPADLAADVTLFNRVMAAEIDGYSIEKRWIRKDGRVVDSLMSTTCVRRTDGSVEFFVGLVQDITQRKHDEAERQDLIRRRMTAQENERRRIAREMHDQFGQQLSALALRLAALRRRSGRRTSLSEELTQLETIVRGLDTDLDLLVSRLRPPSLDDLGLIAALENFVREWSEQFDVHAELHASGIEAGRLTGEIETTLYRVVLEALNNVAKHAHAANAVVLLDRGPARVSLIIEDDGVGFHVEQQSHSHQRFGVTGMRERAMLLGGTFDIESRPGKGTTIAVRIPLPHSEETRR